MPSFQSRSHVSISMDVSDLSSLEAAQEEVTGQSPVDPTWVSETSVGMAQAENSITSSSANDFNRLTQRKVDPIVSNINSPLAPTAEYSVGDHRDLTQYTEFWNAYNDLSDKEDREIVKGYGSDLDTLLIFAGLFAATNTAFIIESYKDLKEDQAETTNKLLRSLIPTIHQPSSFAELYLHEGSFSATKRSTATNIFFFTSLFCSLFAAFGAVIGKQWLNHYEKEGELKSPVERGVERHKKYLGLERWHFQGVIETLPTLLQMSLLSFLMGLVQFLWRLNLPVTIVALIFAAITSGFWFIFVGIGFYYPNCPYQTRLTTLLRKRFPLNMNARDGDTVEDEVIRARCVDWLRKRTTTPTTLAVVAKAVALLSKAEKQEIKLERVGAVIGYLVQSKFKEGCVHFAVTADTLWSSLVTLRDLARNWDLSVDLVHVEDHANVLLIEGLKHELWALLLERGAEGGVAKEAGLQVLERLYAGVQLDQGGSVFIKNTEMWKARCLAWIMRFASESETVWAVTKSILLANNDSTVPKLGESLGLLLQLVIKDGGVFLRVSNESLRVLAPILKTLVSNWDRENDLVHQEDHSNQSFTRALSIKMWSMLLDASLPNDDSGITVLETLGPIGDEQGQKWMSEVLPVESLGSVHSLRVLNLLDTQLRLLHLIPKDHVLCHEAVYQALTTWGSDDNPQHADMRVNWILDDFDAIYPQIESSSYSQYLSRWRCSGPRVSPHSTMLYIRSVHRLVTQDEGLWASRLHGDGHLRHLYDIINDTNSSFDIHLRCLICFFLLFQAPGSDLQSEGSYIPSSDLDLHYNHLSEKWVWMIERNLLSTDGQDLGLLSYMDALVASPAEAIQVISGIWRFLIAAYLLERIGVHRVRLERDRIAAYLMNSPDILSKIAAESDVDLLGPVRLPTLKDILRFPQGSFGGDNTISKSLSKSILIRSIPNIDPDIQQFAMELFDRALPKPPWKSHSDLETVLTSIGRILDEESTPLIEILEKDGYLETIASLIGDATRTNGTLEQLRFIRWWSLRLFLAMWQRRSGVNPTPYISNHCFQRLGGFFTSMKSRIKTDVLELQRGIHEVPHSRLSAIQFMESACIYLEFVNDKRGLKIPVSVISGYTETCGHFAVSGASRSEEYQDIDGAGNWMAEIRPLVRRVEVLSR